MTDPKKRADRWKAKYNLKRVNEMLTDLREDMAARYEPAIAQVYVMEAKVKDVINSCGVSTSQYVPHLSFGRQLYKMSRQQFISGESLAMATQVLLDKWAARGCDPKVLAKIRKEVFDVEAPE